MDLLGVMFNDAFEEEVLVVVIILCMKSSLNLTLPLLCWWSDTYCEHLLSPGSVIFAWIDMCFFRVRLLLSVSLLSIVGCLCLFFLRLITIYSKAFSGISIFRYKTNYLSEF